jgi:hypothetical protein
LKRVWTGVGDVVAAADPQVAVDRQGAAQAVIPKSGRSPGAEDTEVQAIEADEAVVRSQPEIAVRGFRNGIDVLFRQPLRRTPEADLSAPEIIRRRANGANAHQ